MRPRSPRLDRQDARPSWRRTDRSRRPWGTGGRPAISARSAVGSAASGREPGLGDLGRIPSRNVGRDHRPGLILGHLDERSVVRRVARPGPAGLQKLLLACSGRPDRRRARAARRARTSRARPPPARAAAASPSRSADSRRWVFGSSCCSPTRTTSARASSASIASKSLKAPAAGVEHAFGHVHRDDWRRRRPGRDGQAGGVRRAAAARLAIIRSRSCAAGMRPLFVPAGQLVNRASALVSVDVALLQVHGLRLAPQPQVDHLDEHREAHREVDVALRNVLFEAFEQQRHPDQQQERQRQHLHRRMPVHEGADRFRPRPSSTRPTRSPPRSSPTARRPSRRR